MMAEKDLSFCIHFNRTRHVFPVLYGVDKGLLVYCWPYLLLALGRQLVSGVMGWFGCQSLARGFIRIKQASNG